MKSLLSRGSSKLGESIFGWAIPAVHTCPGRSSACQAVCYATKGRFSTRKVKQQNQWRYDQSKQSVFVDRMVSEIFKRGVLVLRVHVAGDFATPAYTRKWIEIAARCPNVTFFGYSRSWRVDTIRPLLYAFGALPNVKLWLSCDRDTGVPQDVPERIRIAWLQDQESQPAPDGDLTFLVRKLRRLSLPLVVPVCSEETPKGKADGVNCSNCRKCWT